MTSRRLNRSPTDGWYQATNATDACRMSNISHAVAMKKCRMLEEDAYYFDACVYDYCASHGDDSLVTNAVESKQREVAMAASVSVSFRPAVAPVSMSVVSAMCVFLNTFSLN